MFTNGQHHFLRVICFIFLSRLNYRKCAGPKCFSLRSMTIFTEERCVFGVDFFTHIIRDSLIGRKGHIYQTDEKRRYNRGGEKEVFHFEMFNPTYGLTA